MHVAKDIFCHFIYRNMTSQEPFNPVPMYLMFFFFFFVIYLNRKRPSIDLKEH